MGSEMCIRDRYVLGKTSFMDMEFKVNSSVLIPRPETEELVRLILKEDLDGKDILDIGTGSGCIAISLAKNFPNAKVTALDISKDAVPEQVTLIKTSL